MRDNDQKYLSNESLGSESFSSNTHNTELLAKEGLGVPGGLEYEIPHRYNMDMLVFLPVNLETSFVYWEVTPALLEQVPLLSREWFPMCERLCQRPPFA